MTGALDSRPLRVAGALVLLGAAWYLPWMFTSINGAAPWISWPFAAASLVLVAAVLLSWINNWHRAAPADLLVPRGEEPLVAVIVPTAGEPVPMLRRTIESVLAQDWPHRRLVIAVGDDARDGRVRSMVSDVARRHPAAVIVYYQPPERGSPDRRGDAKSGNLNAGLAELAARGLRPRVIETRDADDEVGHPEFLRRTVAHLLVDPRVAYVQTIKEAAVAPGDPFGNTDAMFYRGSMLARHAANAVFPCGSGLVWARHALHDIGDFPVWNLVEDLQSGVEALRRGWRGVYVPIVGAIGQTAPEDVPNVFKQRGTWAMDTVRLLVWGQLAGLTVRQRLQFLELGAFYLHGIATLVFCAAPAIGLLLGVYPLVSTNAAYAAHFWPMTIAIEVYLLALGRPHGWACLFRSRQMWIGLAPVYVRAIYLALRYGPHRKPVYKVTRKSHEFRWYWRETLPHVLIVAVLAAATVTAVLTQPLLTALDLGSAYWAVVTAVLLGSFVPRGWFGVRTDRARHRTAPQLPDAAARRAA